MNEKERIIEYIKDNFNVDITTIRLIDSLYDYLDNHNYSKDIINYKNKRVMVNSFIYDLIQLLDNSTIDITMEELLDNKLVDVLLVVLFVKDESVFLF